VEENRDILLTQNVLASLAFNWGCEWADKMYLTKKRIWKCVCGGGGSVGFSIKNDNVKKKKFWFNAEVWKIFKVDNFEILIR
jgi:hypothetical protein